MHKRVLHILGWILLLWFVAKSAHSIQHYGWSKGGYLWFDNLSIAMAGLALLLNSRTLTLLTLGVGFIPLSLLMMDNTLRLFLKRSPFLLTEFLYQPGMLLPEFLMNHAHWFVLPVCLIALFSFKERPKHLMRSLFLGQIAVYALSYLLFLPLENINCVNSPCYLPLEEYIPSRFLNGWRYTLIYALGSSAMGCLVAFLFDRFCRAPKKVSKEHEKRLEYALTFCLGTAVFFVGIDVSYRVSLPTLTCSIPFEDEEVKVGCNFTTDYAQDWLILNYSLWNKQDTPRECASFIEMDGERDLLQESLVLTPRRETETAILIPYPKKDTTLSLSAECRDYY